MKKDNAQSIGNPLPLRILRRIYPFLEKTMPKVAFKMAFQLFFTPIRYKTPEREVEIIKVSEKFDVEINNKRTQFYSWGNEQDPLIIVIHGWMGRCSQFYKLIGHLVEKQYHVVGFDGPAHGASAGRQTSLKEFSEAIVYITKVYGDIKYAIGHSFGGITILNAITNGLKIENVALIATPTIASDIIKQLEEKINGSKATGDNFRKEIIKRFGVSFESMAASELIKNIDLPNLLIVHDEEDRDVPIAHAKLIKSIKPEATTIFTTGLGHTRILRNDGVISQLGDSVDTWVSEVSNS